MASKTTLKDIAKAVGLSVASVSLVLNGKPCRISEENKRLIRQTAQEMKYVPNQTARNLVLRKSHTIGLVIPDIENFYFSSLAKAIEKEVRSAGYALLLASSENVSDGDINLCNMLIQHGVDGFILVVNDVESITDEYLQAIRSLPVPYVMMDRIIDDISCDKVVGDNFTGGYLAAKHLADLGHKKIAGIFNTKLCMNGSYRLEGYKKALEEASIGFDESLVFESDYTIEDGYKLASRVVDSGCSAVVSTADLITLGLLKYFHENKIVVPRDMSVVSYDNCTAYLLFEPSITTIDQHISSVAHSTLDLLLKRIAGQDLPYQTIEIKPELVVNESTKLYTE